jgi:chloramphenicol 3-O-phosphotransferase
MANEWTIQTLKEYLDALRADDRRAIDAALASADRANVKAEAANDKRFDSMNEFRGTLNDQAKLLASRVELEGLEKTVQGLTDRINKSEGRGVGLNQGWGILLGVGSLVAAAFATAAYFLK